ncbi:MAG: GIY-YIG nuclease family protein [Desulfobacteraceae bacterium]|nr:GIY-YIG nuclease family protein [Desulfobacteraceae bacterium]
MDVPYKNDELILFYIKLIRELGSFPIDGQLKLKAKESPKFPSQFSFRRLGQKAERVRKVISFCKNKKEYEDVIEYCEPVAALEKTSSENDFIDNQRIGYVYLIRHGNRKEYKIGKTYNPIKREGEIRLEPPEKVKPIHTIATDEPSGVERYWHNRFSDKRKEGEWFELSADDVRAFKKWKSIH